MIDFGMFPATFSPPPVKSAFQFLIGSSGSAGRLLTPAGFFAMVLLGAGCSSTSFDMKVNSAAKPQAKAAVSYRIESTNPGIDTSSLRYQEAENFVKTALSGKGMYEASKPELADVVVALDYGIGPPVITEKSVNDPIFVNLPGGSHTETVQTGTDSKGNPIYSTVAVPDAPTPQYMGEREYNVVVTTYEKHLNLTAHENKEATEGRPPRTVWGVQVTSEDESKDLRKYLPVLIAASIDYIGKDSGGEIKTIRVNEKDPAIAFVKKGL
jgi:hypothetical protein